MTSDHSRGLRAIVIWSPDVFSSNPLNQQRSQLSSRYWTISRNGGEVTVRWTLLSGISGVERASPVRRRAFFPACFRFVFSAGDRERNRLFVLFRIILCVSRYSGTCPSFLLILCWLCCDTAWFGGSV